MFSSNLMDRFLNVLVRCFRLFCINYIDIVVFHYFSRIALHFIGIIYEDQCVLLISLIIAEDVHELISGGLNAGIGKIF